MSRFSYYQIESSNNNTYVATIEIMSDLYHKVYFGGNKKCVIISVYFDGTHPNIDGFGYDEICNTDGTLERGKGTVDLLLSAMSFVRKKYKSTQFEFKDKSFVECDNKIRVPLMYLHIVKYGKTWYEDKFKAFPIDFPLYKSKVQALKKKLKSYPPWDEICTRYEVPRVFQQALGKMYASFTDIGSFIETLAKNYDCYLLRVWLEKLVNESMERNIHNSSWIIELHANNLKSIRKLHKPLQSTFSWSLQEGGGSVIYGNLTSEL
jgi:hypothetical protein